jgi:hypothetical protein
MDATTTAADRVTPELVMELLRHCYGGSSTERVAENVVQQAG